MAGNDFQLTHTTISIAGIGKQVQFTDLNIQQTLGDVCSGSFNWRMEGNITLQNHIDFYKQTMGKQVDVNIHDDFQFAGVITSIYLSNEDEEASEYLVNFTGLPAQMNQYQECNSWIKQTFTKIVRDVATGSDFVKSPSKDSEELFYTVQYNQTDFEFLQMMAARLGYWMYFDGKDLLFEKPAGSAIELTKEKDIQDITLYSVASKTHETISGFDTYKGAAISNNQPVPKSSGMINVASAAGDLVYGSNRTARHIPSAATEAVLKTMNMMQQKQALSSSVMLQAMSHISKLNIGKKIKVLELNGSSSGEYIITTITHNCPTADSYNNYIDFIPADVDYPPYTNALAFAYCEAQPAIVVDNEDKDGHDRIKVRFAWQKPTEMTPWLTIVTPFAGKDKGMRFIPEKDEEVMVDFISQNAEKPYVIGTMFTGGKKSGIDVGGNCIKMLGTRTGRRFEINDCDGTMKMYDNFSNSLPKNGLLMKRKDDTQQILLESQKSSENYSVIALTNEESCNLGVVSGGQLVVEIKMEKEGQKITIHSKGSIELNADQSISLNSGDINIHASNNLNLEGTNGGVSIKGMKVESEGTTDVSIKGINVAVEASAMLDLKAGAMANLKGALVNIN